MQHQSIIDELGVPMLADYFGLARSSVWRWRQSGIPIEYWRRVMRLAKRNGLPLTIERIALGSPALQGKPVAKDGADRRAA